MRRDRTLKNHWLQLIGAAMDINMKLNEARIFANYSAHVENLELSFREKDWEPNIETCYIWIREQDDKLLALMEGVAKGDRDYRELYDYAKENYWDNGGIKTK